MPSVKALATLLLTALPFSEGPEVHVELRSARGQVVAGESQLFAIPIEFDSGWHIYWKNPGDSGLATTAQIKAPEGFTVGSVIYPAPVRFDQPGGLTCFGYEESACLFVEVTAPKELEGEEFLFTAEVQWLICDEVCFSGEATVKKVLKREQPGAPAAGDFDEEILSHKRRIPSPLPQGWKEARVELVGERDAPTLRVWLPDSEGADGAVLLAESTELFMASAPGLELGPPKAERAGPGLSVLLPCKFKAQRQRPIPTIDGVLAVKLKGGSLRHLSFDARWAPE